MNIMFINFILSFLFNLRRGYYVERGEIRIPSGCAIAAIIDRKGNRINGSEIIKSIALMHDRSNGLGGGFAAYGIYPEHKDEYAIHVFYDSSEAKTM